LHRRLSSTVRQTKVYLSITTNPTQKLSSCFIALIDIHDPQRYQQYLDGFDEIFEKYHGKVLAVEDNPRILEGNWPADRTVVIRFPNDAELRKWYDSDEYQTLAKRRKEASIANIAIITVKDE
jgi:uncharacterized protein (DUF1330 family)